MTLQEYPNHAPVLPIDNSFKFCSLVDEQIIHGDILKCVDGVWSLRDGTVVGIDRRFLALGTAEVIQLWQDGLPDRDEVYIATPTEPLPSLDDLNKKIPEDDWEIRHGEKQAPYRQAYIIYLLDVDDSAIFTFINSSGGAREAVRRLNNRVRWRQMVHGGRPLPIVTLGKRLHSVQFKKLGPDCNVVDWHGINDVPVPKAPKQIEQQAAPVVEISKPVEQPAEKSKPAKKSASKSTKSTGNLTLSDILDDDLPDFAKK